MGSSMFLFCFRDSITSGYLAGSGMSWLFCSQTSIDFLYALYFIPVPQLGTFVGFTSLLDLDVSPFILAIASVILCMVATISLFGFVFSFSLLYAFFIGAIF